MVWTLINIIIIITITITITITIIIIIIIVVVIIIIMADTALLSQAVLWSIIASICIPDIPRTTTTDNATTTDRRRCGEFFGCR